VSTKYRWNNADDEIIPYGKGGGLVCTEFVDIVRLTSKRGLNVIDDRLRDGRDIYEIAKINTWRQKYWYELLTGIDVAQTSFPGLLIADGPFLTALLIFLGRVSYS
jgi:hypothetical protein